MANGREVHIDAVLLHMPALHYLGTRVLGSRSKVYSEKILQWDFASFF